MNDFAKHALALAKAIQQESQSKYIPPSGGKPPRSQLVLPHELVRKTRGYIERIVYQINGCYENGWYDSCAVMMRRLIETLIIEVYEHHGIAYKIQYSSRDFFYLKDLIKCIINEKSWNLGRKSKKSFQELKDIGDLSSHSRRFIAHREDIDKITSDFRTVAQELIYLANLKY